MELTGSVGGLLTRRVKFWFSVKPDPNASKYRALARPS
jgi:hypothetical protein